ncbi:hypothetical protein COO60DRAFT_1472473 [Scenedesmus sp. NREL 46B-D3]|nr:hypothetical protein COO60DRAFT_1472473 [Scenedesmus sp. NREL 46B-D3]
MVLAAVLYLTHVSRSAIWMSAVADVGEYQVNSGLGVSASCSDTTMPGSTVTKGYICRAAMLAHGSAARSSTLSLWLSVTIMTGWPSSLGLKSIDSTSPLVTRATVAVVQMANSGFWEGFCTVTGVVGCALFMALHPALFPLRLPVGVPVRRSGELLPPLPAAPLARAWHGRIAARPQVTLSTGPCCRSSTRSLMVRPPQ